MFNGSDVPKTKFLAIFFRKKTDEPSPTPATHWASPNHATPDPLCHCQAPALEQPQPQPQPRSQAAPAEPHPGFHPSPGAGAAVGATDWGWSVSFLLKNLQEISERD